MSDWSRIGPAYEPTVRSAALRPVTGRVAGEPVRAIDTERQPEQQRPQTRPLYVSFGAGRGGVAGGFGAVAAQLAAQSESGQLAHGRADNAYRQTSARLVEIMRADPPLDLSV